ncbi:ribosomal RNA processing protein 1 homolog [Hylaeus anthracinus]|uniref:ribosomal RNA processing protein 1 homolog n=1 Tax=Hylaeus anthracinus TaxID=313031 RepID=UPI0023B91714|nr:ribosomal RNA processing protein 1 homolog [Hylaeus anthracinus]
MAVKKVQRRTRAPLQKSMQRKLKIKEQQKPISEVKKKDKKAVIIAQEIKFARLLSSNDKRIRDTILKKLKKWLTVRSNSSFAFTDTDFMRLWKGLFYYMWMSDKPLIQEEVAESISKIVHCFNAKDVVVLYTYCALKTLSTEWFGIDQYRLDKFSMLVRRIIRQTFVKCKQSSWDMEFIEDISEILETLLVDPKTCLGFSMHLTEVFLEELSKISDGVISEDIVTELIKPFVSYLIIMDDERQIKHVTRHIFRYLIMQSDIGMDYMEKFQAWKSAGFPAGSIDAMEKVEVSDGEMEDNDEEEKLLQNQMKHDTEKLLDPRAGRVNVELPQIPLNAKQIVALLVQYKFHPLSTTKSRRQLNCFIREFTELSEGKMPLGIKEIRIPITQKKNTDTKLAAKRLLEFEEELYSDAPQRKRKKKKNGQFTKDESNDPNGNCSENISDENTISQIDTIENMKKNRLKKKKFKSKEEVRGSCKIDVKNDNCKLKKETSLSTKRSKKTKFKKNKTISVNTLNVDTPVKKKKMTNINVCGKWDVSDNINTSSIRTSLNDEKKEPHVKIVEKLEKSNTISEQPTWLLPALKKWKNEKISLKEHRKVNTNLNAKKRVKIALQRNTAQHTSEYILQLRKSPSIPFDANRKPLVGVLKASPIPSPINPFYKKKY